MEQERRDSYFNPLSRHRQAQPPKINVTDEKGNVQIHNDYSSYMDCHEGLMLGSEKLSSLHHRAHTFTSLQDAYTQNIHIQTAQGCNNVNEIPANGLLANMALFRKNLENVFMQKISNKAADDVIRELQNVLDSRHIDYQLSPDRAVHLQHLNVQLRMEVVKAGKDVSDLRFRQMAGDSEQCRQLCNELLQCMSL